jgi:dephospho-CoA kinase
LNSSANTDRSKYVPVIGLVGGIGSGKSHLARALAERRPVEIVNGDEAGHQVLQTAEVKREIRERFGDAVFDLSGAVDRRKMAGLVFGSESAPRAARAALEKIVHPRIGELLKQQIEAARRREDIEAIVLDAALLFETGWNRFCDAVIHIDTTEEVRVQRVQTTRGWTRGDLKTREESQWPIDAKRREADYVVENSGAPESAVSQFEEILSRIVAAPRKSPA